MKSKAVRNTGAEKKQKKEKNKTLRGGGMQFLSILKSDLPLRTKIDLVWRKMRNGVSNLPVYFLLISMSFVFLLPFIYMILRSLMDVNDINNSTLVKWIPTTLYWRNYTNAIIALNYWEKLWTSVWTTGVSVLGQLLSCTFVAYGLARLNFKGRGLLFALAVFTLIVPPQVTIAPSFVMFSNNGIYGQTFPFEWLDTFLPMMVPCFFAMGLSGGLFIFIYRQYYKSMPTELENAALIDGCGIFKAYFRVILPNAKSPIMVCLLLSIVWQWNNYFEPSIYITDKVGKGNLPMQIEWLGTNLGGMATQAQTGGMEMAATFLVIVPVVLVFFLLQNQFMKSIERVGLAN